MPKIKLDARKLLGVKVMTQAQGPSAGVPGAKVGLKTGVKTGVKVGVKVGVKATRQS